ncbi:MAG: hypothetical protein ACLR4Z_16165 [Butyricicoccaceae bacterium]
MLFATELTANWFTSWFIQNFGCDAYFAHNKKLLFDDTRAQLLQDIDAAKQERTTEKFEKPCRNAKNADYRQGFAAGQKIDHPKRLTKRRKIPILRLASWG